MSSKPDYDETLATHAGRRSLENHGVVNPPVYRASTILFPTIDAFDARWENRFQKGNVIYGLCGTPTTFALEDAMTALEGGYGCVVLPSGMAAVAMAILAFVRGGDHLLMVDAVYEPTRKFCDNFLAGIGVETTYYDPLIGEGIEALIRPNTRVVYLESPGSLTFEVQDVPAIARASHGRGVRVLMDNTWATPLYFKPFEHGVDVSIHAGTKYISGHSDIMSGLVTVTEEFYEPMRRTVFGFGQCAGADDTYAVLRGLRTMPARLSQQSEQAMEIAKWLKNRPEVGRVLHPALPDCPGHEHWRRDYLGASSLFGFTLRNNDRNAVSSFIDGMRLFGIGASWGGYESLLIPAYPESLRTATKWPNDEFLVRIHVGLEHKDDLIADLEQGFERMRSISSTESAPG